MYLCILTILWSTTRNCIFDVEITKSNSPRIGLCGTPFSTYLESDMIPSTRWYQSNLLLHTHLQFYKFRIDEFSLTSPNTHSVRLHLGWGLRGVLPLKKNSIFFTSVNWLLFLLFVRLDMSISHAHSVLLAELNVPNGILTP